MNYGTMSYQTIAENQSTEILNVLIYIGQHKKQPVIQRFCRNNVIPRLKANRCFFFVFCCISTNLHTTHMDIMSMFNREDFRNGAVVLLYYTSCRK